MKCLFFTNTPAQVHMFKHAVSELADAGHDVYVLAREYGCTQQLLEHAGIEYELYGECDTEKSSLVRELPVHFKNIFARARSFDPDLVVGIGAYAAFAGAVTETPTVTITDSEPSSIDQKLSKLLTDVFLTPEAFRKSLGSNHYRFDGCTEIAYLHPEVFDPDPGEISDHLDVQGEDYVVVRFNAFGSHHDVNHVGFSPDQKRRLIDELADHGTVFVSDEAGGIDVDAVAGRALDIHPASMHHALSEATLLVADTQTMVTEAALLGTPAIRSNSFVGDGDMGNFVELEEYGLVYNLDAFEKVLDRAVAVLEDPTIQRTWDRRRDEYLRGKANLTHILVEIAQDFAETERRDIVEVIRNNPSLTA